MLVVWCSIACVVFAFGFVAVATIIDYFNHPKCATIQYRQARRLFRNKPSQVKLNEYQNCIDVITYKKEINGILVRTSTLYRFGFLDYLKFDKYLKDDIRSHQLGLNEKYTYKKRDDLT